MKFKHLLLFTILFMVSTFSFGQDFLQGYDSYSTKADSYLYLTDGTEVVGQVKKLKKKKGLIDYVKVKVGEETVKYMASDVSHMYLKPSKLEKFSKSMDNAFDVTERDKDRSINEGFIKEGYIYYETVTVQLKKSEKTLLMQLVNPGFSGQIKVYYDPWANETASTGIGGMKLAGGDAKSYYVQHGDAIAYKLKKKNYDDDLKNLYGDCNIADGFEGKVKWKDFAKHIVYASSNCAGNTDR